MIRTVTRAIDQGVFLRTMLLSSVVAGTERAALAELGVPPARARITWQAERPDLVHGAPVRLPWTPGSAIPADSTRLLCTAAGPFLTDDETQPQTADLAATLCKTAAFLVANPQGTPGTWLDTVPSEARMALATWLRAEAVAFRTDPTRGSVYGFPSFYFAREVADAVARLP